jgi:hypothetical protein
MATSQGPNGRAGSYRVQGQQNILYSILDIPEVTMTACSKGAQERRDLLEQAAVSSAISALGARHQDRPVEFADRAHLTCAALPIVPDYVNGGKRS